MKERDALQTEVKQLKSGKMNERHFSAAFQKEFEKSGEFQAKYHQVLDQCSVSGFELASFSVLHRSYHCLQYE